MLEGTFNPPAVSVVKARWTSSMLATLHAEPLELDEGVIIPSPRHRVGLIGMIVSSERCNGAGWTAEEIVEDLQGVIRVLGLSPRVSGRPDRYRIEDLCCLEKDSPDVHPTQTWRCSISANTHHRYSTRIQAGYCTSTCT